MNKRWLVTIAVAAFSHALVGCGNPPGFYSVSGKVLHHGEPAAGAVVYFHKESPPASALQAIPFGIVADDGSFYLTCDNLGNGCPARQVCRSGRVEGSRGRRVAGENQGQNQLGEAKPRPVGARPVQGPLFRHEQALAPR